MRPMPEPEVRCRKTMEVKREREREGGANIWFALARERETKKGAC